MNAKSGKRQLWEERIKGWQSSGLSQREYCEREGLSRASFGYWRRRLNRNMQQAHEAQPMTFVPVPIAQTQTPTKIAVKSPTGWELTAPVSTDIAWLSALLRSLP